MSRSDREKAIFINKLTQIKENLLQEFPDLNQLDQQVRSAYQQSTSASERAFTMIQHQIIEERKGELDLDDHDEDACELEHEQSKPSSDESAITFGTIPHVTQTSSSDNTMLKSYN